jgi:hypothetical protein
MADILVFVFGISLCIFDSWETNVMPVEEFFELSALYKLLIVRVCKVKAILAVKCVRGRPFNSRKRVKVEKVMITPPVVIIGKVGTECLHWSESQLL